MSFEIRHYVTVGGIDLFAEWFARLADRQAQARIQTRIDRLERGLFGDCDPVGEGVSELRIDRGPGYRVYFARAGERVVLLLCGGDKRRQQAEINRAKECWHDYQERKKPKGRAG